MKAALANVLTIQQLKSWVAKITSIIFFPLLIDWAYT